MTTEAHKYGYEHRRRRAALRPHVEAGEFECIRCGHQIQPGQAWDLDHDDFDPSVPTLPAHARCNRATAGNGIAVPRRPATHRWSRDW